MGLRPAILALALSAPLCPQELSGPLAEKAIRFHQQPSTAAQRARSPLPPDPARVVRQVRPRDADPAVSQFLLDHYAILYRNGPKNGRLFLFFPGTFGWPQGTQWVLDTAARAGYLALGLEYVNTTLDPSRTSLITLCSDDADTKCAGNVRRERIFGEDASDKVEVGRADSIVGRVEKALALLAREHPDDGWGGFLDSKGQVRWDRVAAGGHSQGAGMAAYLAKKVELARVCLFSGAGDFSRAALKHADWLKEPSATPADRFFGMAHEKENIYRGVMGGYEVLGMNAAGPAQKWSPGVKLADTGHVVTVSLPPAPGTSFGDAAHSSVAVDGTTPKDAAGAPAFRPVWEFLMGKKESK